VPREAVAVRHEMSRNAEVASDAGSGVRVLQLFAIILREAAAVV
jgi:hypothetical protein